MSQDFWIDTVREKVVGKLDKCPHDRYGYEPCEECATADLWRAIRQRDKNINDAFAALNAIEAQLHEMRSLKGWRLNLIRESLGKAKAALRTPTEG